MKTIRQNYLILVILILVFIAPGLFAYYFYLHPQKLSTVTINKGRLLAPPILLTELGERPKWKLMLWSPTVCEQACMQQLDQLARIRLALGRHLYEVDVDLVSNAATGVLSDQFANILHTQDVLHVQLSPQEVAHLLALPTDSRGQPQIFIANPNAYIVLAYPITANSADIFHDLKHLLTKG